jgi:hypothetical protein
MIRSCSLLRRTLCRLGPRSGGTAFTLRQQTFEGRLCSVAALIGFALSSISGRSIREGGKARAAMDVYAESST